MDVPLFSPSAPTQMSGVPALLGLAGLLRGKASGLLKVTQQKIVRQVQASEGRIVLVTSNARSELPGAFLLQEGKLTKEQHEAYLADVKSGGKLWEKALSLAALTDEDAAAAKHRYALKIASLLGPIESADLHFQPGAPPSGPGIHPLTFLAGATPAVPEGTALKICPLFDVKNSLRVNAAVQKEWSPLPLPPEEKGLFTVVENSRTVGEVFEGSFIKPDRIRALLLAFWLGGLIELESAESAREKAFEASLTPERRALRQEIRARMASADSASYYSWLGIDSKASAEEIDRSATNLIEKYAAPDVEKLFPDEAGTIDALLQKLAEARKVLKDPATRSEYDRFLASGKTGSFRDQSVTLALDGYLKKAILLEQQKQGPQALALYEEALAKLGEPPLLVASYADALLRWKGPNDSAARQRAVADLTKAASAHPTHAEVFEVMGDWMEALKQNDRAIRAYLMALDLAPSSARARAGLEKIDPTKAGALLVAVIHKKMNRLSFYELLGVDPRANLAEIQKAYRECTRKFHPDRFFTSSDPELKERANQIYKRMVEAYMTLKNPTKRKAYDGRTAGA